MKTYIQTLSIMALAASLSCGGEAPAAGKEKKRPEPEQIFKKLDVDGNGSISLEEFKAPPKAKKDEAKAEQVFKKFNADHSDGGINLQEFKDGRAARAPKGEAKPRKHKKKDAAAAQ
jgi:Ca2+-binding EF-hand superfamily protein